MPKIIAKNKRAFFDYLPVDTYLAGIELIGAEVKSVRHGNVDLKGSYVTLHGGSAFLTNAHIRKYEFANNLDSYEPTRSRRLLLNQKELASLERAKQNGLTIVPLSIELAGRYIKLRIASARGKKLIDKRQTIQKRDLDREASRETFKKQPRRQ